MGKQLADIDGNKLRVLLNSWCSENSTNIYKLSEVFGYSQTWLYDVTKRGRIRKNGIKMLKDFCGIDYADYKMAPPKQEVEETEVVEETVEETTDLKEIAAALNKIAAIQERNAELLETLITMLK